MSYSFFEIDKRNGVALLWLNRPQKRNFMSWEFWDELPRVVAELDRDDDIRVLCFAGKGASFSMGLDLPDFIERFPELHQQGSGENREHLLRLIQKMQQGFKALIASEKPSVAAVHRHCIGGALDLISACDIRFCSADAQFSLREIKVHIVADMGSLQLLPHIIGDGMTRDLALTGRDVDADEALRIGLVSRVFPDKDSLHAGSVKFCEELAANEAIVSRGVKRILNKARNESVLRGLDDVALYNSSFLQVEPFLNFMKQFVERKKK